MGAFGAALYAQKLHRTRSSILNYEQLKNFTHKSVSTTCQGCTNHCALTINTFSDGSRLVAGNKCEKMIIHDQKEKLEIPDLFKEKASMMQKVQKNISHAKKIGMPLVLNNYDLLPFWTNFFDVLGYEVVWSTQVHWICIMMDSIQFQVIQLVFPQNLYMVILNNL